jgi:selenocysteine lyase/cysteine desulfurase
MSSIDLNKVRSDTPGCDLVLHFNNAGAALMPHPVLDAVISHLEFEATVGGYEAAARSRDAIRHVYDAAAILIGCQREEIAMVENATRAWDMAFYAVPFQKGDRILTCMAEYASNYIAFLQMAKRRGVEILAIPNDGNGQVSIDALRDMIDDRVRLIAITHVPTNGGLVNPAEEIGKVAQESEILYLLDACQSVGHLPIDVNAIGCDFLSATGRKYLRGPRGTGFLYVRRNRIEKLEPPFLDLHAAKWIAENEFKIRTDARRFENWESYIAGKIGLAKAIDYTLELGIDVIWERIQSLADSLRIRLRKIPGVTVRDQGAVQCGIVTFTVDGYEPARLKSEFLKKSINVTVSDRDTTRLDMEARNLENLVRASVHYYNSEEEVERFCVALTSIIQNPI